MTQADLVHNGDHWTLIFVRELPQPVEKVWHALTDPAELDQWAPFSAAAGLDATGDTTLTMVDGDERTDLPTTVRLADKPHLLEYSWGDDLLRWELTPTGTGTRLTLRHTLTDPAMKGATAAGWHICTDVLERLLDGHPVGVIRGRDAMDHGWEELRDRYDKVMS